MSDRALSVIARDITDSLHTIVRLETKLAMAELRQWAADVQGAMIMALIGVAASVFAVGFLLLSAFFGLSLTFAPWLAALVMGSAIAVGAGIAGMLGRRKFSGVQLPRKTIASLQETLNELRNQIDRA